MRRRTKSVGLEIEFQSTNPRVRRLYRRRVDYRTYSSQLNRGRKGGTLLVHVGLPGDNMCGVLKTLQAAYFLRPERIKLVPFHLKKAPNLFRPGVAERLTQDRRDVAWQMKIARVSTSSFDYWAALCRRHRPSSAAA